MNTKKIVSVSAQVSIITLFFVTVNLLYIATKKPKLIINLQKEIVNINPDFVKVVSLGQNRLISSFLWISTLLRADLKHYDKNDYNSWMFLRLKLITSLSPMFYETYLYGGIYLSIIKDDDLGAKYIYDKGIEIYPKDHRLLYNSGFHHFSELSDYPMAITLFQKALDNGATHPVLPTLIARLKAGEGNMEDAKILLINTLKTTPKESFIYQRITFAIYAITAEMDLNCLNNQGTACNKYDYNGKKYIKKNGIYKSSIEWQKFRIKKGKQ
jgi:tetratricopeptide (TPR) repeat protein